MHKVIPCLQGHKSFWAAQPASPYFGQEPQLAQRIGLVACLLADT